jgi:simple sugar transport system substrate-binding protein
VKAAAEKVEAGIASHQIYPFTGPIEDRNGKLRIKAGEHASDDMLLGMDWFVPGVNGDLPK